MTYTGTDRIDEFFLVHSGIKGQKWGVRRFETQQGYLTPAGKARYAKYNDGRYDKNGDSSTKRRPEHASSKNIESVAVSNKKVKANKWQNADGTLTSAGKKRYRKYTKQLGYDNQHPEYGLARSKASSMAIAAANRLMSNKIRNAAFGVSLGASKKLVEMSKTKGAVDQGEVNRNALKMFGGLGVAGLMTAQQHAADKRRKFLIKYSEAYGGEKAKDIANKAKAARNTTRAISIASAGASLLKVLSGKRTQEATTETYKKHSASTMRKPLALTMRKPLALTMRR